MKPVYGLSAQLIMMLSLLVGCAGSKTPNMMPSPVIYHDSAIDPFVHLDESEKETSSRVFYATNRKPEADGHEMGYGNAIDRDMRLGEAIVRMGAQENDWSDLYSYSLGRSDFDSMPIQLSASTEIAAMQGAEYPENGPLSDDLQRFIDEINREISNAIDKEIVVYVHGAKVDFANSTILTAEIDHFAGRDFVGLAFAWPSHQNIFAYMTGVDVKHARASSNALQNLLRLLAEYTDAEHINLIAYSAGGIVSTRALYDLRQVYPGLSSAQLRNKFRIGAVAFAAIDVEVDVFLERLPSISELAEQVVITVTENDYALNAAKKYMGGEARAGSRESEAREEAFIVEHHLGNTEIIDVSLGHEMRGFDIEGHHYWYRHPWMSSEIIFLMRTRLPPGARGLTASEIEGVWYLSSDYPEKIRGAAKRTLME